MFGLPGKTPLSQPGVPGFGAPLPQQCCWEAGKLQAPPTTTRLVLYAPSHPCSIPSNRQTSVGQSPTSHEMAFGKACRR